MNDKDYLDDICQFCETIWGSDKSIGCTTPCICATYISQDYVPQREFTIGLPSPRPWPVTLVPEAPPEPWAKLAEEIKSKTKEEFAEFVKQTPSYLFEFLTMIMLGHTKEEICYECRLKDDTFYQYAARLKSQAEGRRGKSHKETPIQGSRNSKSTV